MSLRRSGRLNSLSRKILFPQLWTAKTISGQFVLSGKEMLMQFFYVPSLSQDIIEQFPDDPLSPAIPSHNISAKLLKKDTRYSEGERNLPYKSIFYHIGTCLNKMTYLCVNEHDFASRVPIGARELGCNWSKIHLYLALLQKARCNSCCTYHKECGTAGFSLSWILQTRIDCASLVSVEVFS